MKKSFIIGFVCFCATAGVFAQQVWGDGSLAFLTTGEAGEPIADFSPEPLAEITFEAEAQEADVAEFAQESQDVAVAAESPQTVDDLATILFTIDEKLQIVCRFVNLSEEKIIEIMSISGGVALEILADSTQDYVSIPSSQLEKGIYVLRVLSPETRVSLFSRLIVIG